MPKTGKADLWLTPKQKSVFPLRFLTRSWVSVSCLYGILPYNLALYSLHTNDFQMPITLSKNQYNTRFIGNFKALEQTLRWHLLNLVLAEFNYKHNFFHGTQLDLYSIYLFIYVCHSAVQTVRPSTGRSTKFSTSRSTWRGVPTMY